MKPIYQKLIGRPDEGLIVKEIRGDACNCPWHCHAEVELVLVLQSRGYRIVGDNIRSLQSGDMMLLGPNLPHAYQHTDRLALAAQQPHCLLLQFDASLWSGVLELPAATGLQRLLHRAEHGLQIGEPVRRKAAAMLADMLKLRGMRRVIAFLELLNVLSKSKNCRTVASPGFTSPATSHQQERIGNICQYIDANYDRTLRIGEIARLAHMSEGAVSRFFRAHVGKTFPAFVNDLRVGRACRLLADTEMNVTEIALSCGYANLSNFNRQFLRLKKISPVKYRRHMRKSV